MLHHPTKTIPEGAVKVTMDEFFSIVGPLDVHPHVVAPWPFHSVFLYLSGPERGKEVGRCVEYYENGDSGPMVKDYYIIRPLSEERYITPRKLPHL